MKKIDHPSSIDGPVVSEGGRSLCTRSTGQAPPALTATPAAAPPPRRRRDGCPCRWRAWRHLLLARGEKTGALGQHDTDAVALAAHPGRSQGRPAHELALAADVFSHGLAALACSRCPASRMVSP